MPATNVATDGYGPDATDAGSPEWLELPEAKKEIARTRARVLDAYLANRERNADLANRAANELGVNRARFFGLLKSWREQRSLVALVPHANTIRKRPAVAMADIGDARAIVTRLVSASRERSPAAVVASLMKAWPAEAAKPSGLQMVMLVREEIERPAQGFAIVPQPHDGDLETASSFGEVLVLDHTAPEDLYVHTDDGPVRPTLTLAIDLCTTTVAGLHVALHPPGPNGIEAALKDAAAGYLYDPAREWITPRLMLNVDWQPAWTDLCRELTDASQGLTVRRTPRLHHGRTTQRLIGRTLGRLRLAPRKSHDASRGRDGFDPSRHSPLSLEDALEVIRANAKLHAAPLMAGIESRRINLLGDRFRPAEDRKVYA